VFFCVYWIESKLDRREKVLCEIQTHAHNASTLHSTCYPQAAA
jgi:hypothetical protein